MGKWLELTSLMITSAELIFSKVSEKGRMLIFFHLDTYILFELNHELLLGRAKLV
jgi:translation initiation factor 3 subunit M